MAILPTSDRDQSAQEQAVGISTFVRPDVPGFSCIVKQRYTDFLVNEVLPNGQVLHLIANEPDQDRKRKRQDDQDTSQKKLKSEIQEDTAVTSNGANSEVKGESKPAEAVTKPEVKADSAAQAIDTKATKEEAIASISDADKSVLKDVFGDEATSAIINLYAAVKAFPEKKPRDHATINSPPIEEKSKRTEAHLCIRRIFDSKLETITVQDQQNQSGPGTVIAIKAAPPRPASNANGNGKRNGETQRGKQNWAELGGEYLHFSLYKENKDTMEVLYFIASQLKMNMKHFGFAGTKDRRGVTVQRVSAHRVLRGRLESLNKQAKGWRVGGPWEYKNDGLTLGMSNGNQFLLTLRDAHSDNGNEAGDLESRLQNVKACAEAAAKSLQENGFLNYYGLQRFGTHSTGTHAVGMKILQGDLKGAVDSILAYDEALLQENQDATSGADSNGSAGNPRKVPQDDINRATAIHAFRKTGGSSQALAILQGNRFSAEKGMITHLGKKDRQTGKRPNENDFQGALMTIQRGLRLMYVHAYQSFVWNTVAGKRWEMHGPKVVEGDLVVVGEKEAAEGVSNGAAAVKEEVDEHGEPIIHPAASADAGSSGATGELDDPFVRARPLSKEEAESGRYNIFDVVLPLPGFDVVYPKNELGKFYIDFMASEEGGKLDPFNMRHTVKDFSLSGGYRKVMARPSGAGVEVEVKPYSTPEEQLVETDLDKLRNAGKKDAATPATHSASAAGHDKVAVVLKLQLGSSQYATMALRELTKGAAMGFTPNYSVANR
ncbi:Putative pseudouridine synthase, TruD, pseudouridine synthase, catalytic domain superfamily [Septoria linicola]|uniref:Pseudouridine synthase, TruD, pseudouridine synthase, catalytic domain superfamily n=1 Tax=Septoria linicola TaxID=215465 RepID=A0A9Q9EHG3_9PEZI|nr:putative pseudouridine synthase, TruD, pseudouridine synthase, catalytic domain superfamily [Septoria linicola]USW49892.1 Putative pseudouridine synthase, TruD, pseudouridine synthase, catalytic domain superfamily [Septoria linicola]